MPVSSASAAALSPLPEISEGDTFFALATFVSETGEAMNLVEGEKVKCSGMQEDQSSLRRLG